MNVVEPPLSVAFVPGTVVHAPFGDVSVMMPVEVVPANRPVLIFVTSLISVSYTHLTLPTNREV